MPNATSSWVKFPEYFEPLKAWEIADQAELILATLIPGSVARRYDFPVFDRYAPEFGNYSPIRLCFCEFKPVVPILSFEFGKNYALAIPNIYYQSMLRDARDCFGTFPAPDLGGSDRLDSGPEKIAVTVGQLASKYDFGQLVAAGTAERLIDQYAHRGDPWWDLFSAEYATYLGRTDDARAMLRSAVKLARDTGRANLAGLIAEAEGHLVKLDSGVLRNELVATMEYNWAHFKVVETEIPVRR